MLKYIDSSLYIYILKELELLPVCFKLYPCLQRKNFDEYTKKCFIYKERILMNVIRNALSSKKEF